MTGRFSAMFGFWFASLTSMPSLVRQGKVGGFGRRG